MSSQSAMPTLEQRVRMEAAANSGVCAIAYVLRDENWAAFAAVAGELTGDQWGEQERENMARDGMLLASLAETLEKLR